MMFECMGGPLDGKIRSTPSSALPWLAMNLVGGAEPCAVSGEYRPPAPGTEVINADGLPIWHWYASE